MLWLIFALMTAAAVFAVLWPLGHKPSTVRGGSDRLVYQDQLREIDRDHAAGLIGEAEAATARIEISRRLLAAAATEAQDSAAPAARAVWQHRIAAIAALAVMPAIALGLYLKLGSPDVPGQSAFSRGDLPPGHQSVADLVSQVEAHLAREPDDGAGWEVIAPVYLRMGRFDDAVIARRKAIALRGDTAQRESDLGEALVAAADGVVTAEAKQAFRTAVNEDPHDPLARYFLGLADEQDGNTAAAAAKWHALLDEAPPGAPWVNFVRAALSRVAAAPQAANGPTAADTSAADAMTEGQRTAMIRGMVQRLADRLHADGGDVEGWLRLVRAYTVLGDRDKAKGAAADARRALLDHPDAIKRVDDLVKGLGLEG
jgi:cytochrome c-type biogenesis protein CcmH